MRAWLPGCGLFVQLLHSAVAIQGSWRLVLRRRPNLDPGISRRHALAPQYLRAQRLTSSSNGWWRTPRPVTAIAEATVRSDGRRHRRRGGLARAAAPSLATCQITR